MATINIPHPLQPQPEAQASDQLWEEESYQAGCAFARKLACQKLQAMEERLFKEHPPAWQVEGFRERTLRCAQGRLFVTRFGEVQMHRRLYRDSKGEYHFLLDEHLGWAPHQAGTPSLEESVVELASKAQFQEVADTLEKLTAGVLSRATIHRMTGRLAQRAQEEEGTRWDACFKEGQPSPSASRGVPLLFMEADGVWVHLQREKQSHYEVKSAVAYEGWERLSQREERYRVLGKRWYCHGDERMPFWEGASLEFERKWDLSRLRQVVIGGDGAPWIEEGVGYFAGALYQRDGFHLARWCRWAVGREQGKELYQAIRQGHTEEARKGLAEDKLLEGKKAREAKKVVEGQMETGVDWRRQLEEVTEVARGLGTMESQQDKLVANRMKKRGMSWTIRGAQRMAKVIQLVANGEVSRWCRQRVKKGKEVASPSERKKQKRDYGDWLQAGVPALWGPTSCRPWVKALHSLAYPSYRLN